MSSRIPAPCPHDLRPGTVVCLHCRHAEHLAITARQRRTMAMVAAAVLAVGGLASGAVMAFTGGASGSGAARAALVAEPRQPGPAADSAPADAPPSSAIELPPADAPTPILPVAAIRAPSLPAGPAAPGGEVRPIVAEGRTALGGGMVAVRRGDTVRVHFDVPNTRTRRADKFERLVRTTLPAVYGAPADAALAAVPDGQLARPGDLLTDLPRRGVRLRTADGATLAVWPQTRPGRDGPLVVTYLATIER